MSVEGMWALLSGQIDENFMFAGGVIVLETGRLFGGDSLVAYVGSYTVEGSTMTAQVERWKYNVNVESDDVFGEPCSTNMLPVTFKGVRGTAEGEEILSGEIWRDAIPEVRLPIYLKKLRELP